MRAALADLFFRGMAMLIVGLFLLLTAHSASAAEPLIGGKLSAGGAEVIVVSQGTVPVLVTMTADAVSLSEATFQLAPGQSHRLTYSGESRGTVTAHLAQLPSLTGGDSASVDLVVHLKPYTPPTDWSGILYGLLGLTALAVILRKVKPWRYRITRAT